MSSASPALSLGPEIGLDERREAILAAFKGNIQPVTAGASYRLGIALVAVVMLLLPLIYVALIGLVCYGVHYHSVNHTALLGSVRGRAAVVTFVIYLAPVVVGGILVLFMLKPLFSRPAKRPRTRTLKRQAEPVLFAFVDRICEAVGAPRPRQIQVDCEVNASASFRRGLLSMFGNDLVLTVGAPLVAGLNLREFGGVLAHEFGHFAQGAGMRLTYVIRSISFWFTRVVYERDEWDQRLIDWTQELDIRIGWILYVAQFFVWMTRKVLWCLMMAGHVVAGYMLRQMELDADRHEARLAGSETFEATVRRLVVLNFAHQGAQADLGRFYQEGRLADDLPRLIMANVDQLPAEAQKTADEVVEKSETGWFDTHPCDRERIASAEREKARGVFRLDPPAAVLFRDFAQTSRDVTADFYHNVFGPTYDREKLHPVEDLLTRQGKELETYKALRRYFQDAFSAWRPVRLPRWTLKTPGAPKEAVAQLRQARAKLLSERPRFQEHFKSFDEADTWQLQAEQGTALLNARVKADRNDFPMPLTTQAQVTMLVRSSAERREQSEPGLTDFETLAASRLLAALDFLTHPAVAKRLDSAEEHQHECATLFECLSVLEANVSQVMQIRNTLAALGILLGKWEANQENQRLAEGIRERMGILSVQLGTLRQVLRATSYPFDHADRGMTLGAYAVPEMPAEDDLGGLLQAADGLVNTLPQLRARIVGRLCQIAEEVETVLRLEPLPEPPRVDADTKPAE